MSDSRLEILRRLSSLDSVITITCMPRDLRSSRSHACFFNFVGPRTFKHATFRVAMSYVGDLPYFVFLPGDLDADILLLLEADLPIS